MLRRMLEEAAALVAPPACAACRSPVAAGSGPLCAQCRRDLPWLSGPRCERCGLPGRCARCPARTAAFAAAWAPMAYAASARGAVAALKYGGAWPLADMMAAQMLASAPSGLLAGAVLVPVPAHPVRRRRRGYDQAELIARALSARGGLAVCPCLRRRGASVPQAGATRRERLAAGRIQVEARLPVPGTALLIDDVHTTGATLDACARALLEAGAGEVRCLAYARALR